MNDKAKIYGFIGMEVYDLSRENEIEIEQIRNYRETWVCGRTGTSPFQTETDADSEEYKNSVQDGDFSKCVVMDC